MRMDRERVSVGLIQPWHMFLLQDHHLKHPKGMLRRVLSFQTGDRGLEFRFTLVLAMTMVYIARGRLIPALQGPLRAENFN